jgi:hypothetical protein
MDEMKLKALKKAMEKYGEALVLEIVKQLKDADKIATGALARSVDYELIEALDSIAVNILALDYMDVVDGGRRKGAKAPPTGAIIKWMKVRKIKGRDKRGRFIKDKSAAFLISRSIGKKGIKGVYAIKKSVNKLKSLQQKLLTEAAVEDMTKMIQGVFLNNL